MPGRPNIVRAGAASIRHCWEGITALVVYSRLGTVLQQRGMPLQDLRSRLASLLDSPIDPHSLVALARDERMQRPDIELLAAIALTLESPVDELLDVRDAPIGADESHASPENSIVLDAARDQRRRHLVEHREREDGSMTAAEQDELEALTTATASALIDRSRRVSGDIGGNGAGACRGGGGQGGSVLGGSSSRIQTA